jgi:hypothetical protein
MYELFSCMCTYILPYMHISHSHSYTDACTSIHLHSSIATYAYTTYILVHKHIDTYVHMDEIINAFIYAARKDTTTEYERA